MTEIAKRKNLHKLMKLFLKFRSLVYGRRKFLVEGAKRKIFGERRWSNMNVL